MGAMRPAPPRGGARSPRRRARARAAVGRLTDPQGDMPEMPIWRGFSAGWEPNFSVLERKMPVLSGFFAPAGGGGTFFRRCLKVRTLNAFRAAARWSSPTLRKSKCAPPALGKCRATRGCLPRRTLKHQYIELLAV